MRQVFVVRDQKHNAVYVFDNHDVALKCRRDLKLTHWHLVGCTVSSDWIDGGPR